MLNHIDAFYPPLADTLKNFPGGFGYPKSLRKAFKYLTEFGVCREDACPYDSKIHRQDSPPLAIPRVFILEYGNLKNVHEVSLHIKEHPLVLAVPFVKYLTSYKKSAGADSIGSLIYLRSCANSCQDFECANGESSGVKSTVFKISNLQDILPWNL